MAKLSAHKVQLRRFEIITRSNEGDIRTHTFSVHSDGHILKKFSVKCPDGFAHDYGWKLWKRFKNPRELTQEKLDKIELALRQAYQEAEASAL